jgi:mono/diheme cytochrome c family protein
MKRSLLLVTATVLVCFLFAAARLSSQDNAKPPDKVPPEDAARVNPIKSSAEGLAEARKVFGYDCEMCHGKQGDGKGDVVESMKLTMHDWREPATLANLTDGEIFFIITKGRGKMMAEGDRVPEKLRWNLVNYVRSLAAKPADQKSASSAPPSS